MNQIGTARVSSGRFDAAGRREVRPLRFFEEGRLQAYGYGLAVIYAAIFAHFFHVGSWILDGAGAPVYTDFTTIWVAGIEAVRGEAARLYDSAAFLKMQEQLLGPRPDFYPNWPYPPTMLLLAAPVGALPYLHAFLSWDAATLGALLLVTYLIVRRVSAIPLVLASPFTAWNFMAGQNGFLTGSLLGVGLLCLERRPVLAGIFIGCLTYKPQFGILIPVALLAGRQWRAIASAAATAVVLAALSAAAFGLDAWEMLPTGLLAQKNVVLLAEGASDAGASWSRIQSIYGLVRELHAGGSIATLLQAVMTLVAAAMVWRVWRSRASYALKAAVVSVAALTATPYAFTYDMAALAIPMAFLVRDQLREGLHKGEQTALLALFGIVLAAFAAFWASHQQLDFGILPLGPAAVLMLLVLALRRAAISLMPGSRAI